MSKEAEKVEEKVVPEETKEIQEIVPWYQKTWNYGLSVGKRFGEFLKKNKGNIVPFVLGAMTLTGAISSMFAGKGNEDCLIEDDRTHENLLTDEPLTNKDILNMGRLMKEKGYSKAEALDELDLLKNEKKRK